MSAFWAMGGYAAYVWPAYGTAALGLGGLALATWRTLRARRREAAALKDEG